MTDLTRTGNRWIRAAAPLAVSALVFAVFSRSLSGKFLNLDDEYNFVFNTAYRGFGWANLKWMFTSFGLGPYSPLMWLTAAADHAVWGLDPFGWHLSNVLLHCANAAVFYFLCRTLFSARSGAEDDGAGLSLAAGTAALIFGLHPLCVETVSLASNRPNLLLTLFYQLAMLAYVSARRPGAEGAPATRRHALPLSLFALALLSKGTGVTLPLVLLLLDVYPLGRLAPDIRKWSARENRDVLAEKLPYFALSLAFGTIAIAGQSKLGTIVPMEMFGPGERAAQALYGLAFYPLKTALPSGLIPFYWFPSGSDLSLWRTLWTGVAAAGLTAAALAARRRAPAVTAAWAYYLLTVWPMLGLVKVNEYWAADRYAYIVCLGFFALAGAGVLRILRSGTEAARTRLAAAAFAVLAVFSALTWRQQGFWLDSMSLWERTLSADPGSWKARGSLCGMLAEQGKPEEAIAYCEAALRIKPDFSEAHTNIGNALYGLGRREEAVERYRTALLMKPDLPEAHNNIGVALAAMGSTEEALRHHREALHYLPDYPEAHNNIGMLMSNLGRKEEAAARYREALRINPYYPEAHNNLGLALAASGRYEEAMEHYREALRLKPGFPEAHYHLGLALTGLGRKEEAMSRYREALRLRPGYPQAHNNLGVALSLLGRMDEALAHYVEAARLRPDDPEIRNNLALALAVLGRRDEAAAEYRRILRLRPGFPVIYYDAAMAAAARKKR